jgi:hypothetical protein
LPHLGPLQRWGIDIIRKLIAAQG